LLLLFLESFHYLIFLPKHKLSFHYIHLNPYIIYKTDKIGGYDLELELNVYSSKQLYEIIDKMIEHFPGIFESYEILEYDKEYKMSLMDVL